MGTTVVDHVLSVEEVRKRFKDVNAAALHQQAVIHYGERGADQLVILSRELWESLLADHARSAATQSGPYAAFNRALAAGRLGSQARPVAEPMADPPRRASRRRRLPGLSDVSTRSLEEMVAAGREDRAPRRRRAGSPAGA